VIWHWRLE